MRKKLGIKKNKNKIKIGNKKKGNTIKIKVKVKISLLIKIYYGRLKIRLLIKRKLKWIYNIFNNWRRYILLNFILLYL